MSDKNLPQKSKGTDVAVADDKRDYVTMFIGGQLFGIPVLQVQDVLGAQRITRIPLAPTEIAGSLNLRGRIVTAIDLRARLGMDKKDDGKPPMSIVVEFKNELYSLMVDSVGEVLSLPARDFEQNPPTLQQTWREVSSGVYRLDGKLLIVLGVEQLLNFAHVDAA